MNESASNLQREGLSISEACAVAGIIIKWFPGMIWFTLAIRRRTHYKVLGPGKNIKLETCSLFSILYASSVALET